MKKVQSMSKVVSPINLFSVFI